MKFKTIITIIVTMVSVFAIIASTSFLGMDKVFAQSSIFGNNNGGVIGNLFNNFGNTLGNLGTSISPSVSSDPLTGLFGNAPNNTPNDKSTVLSSLSGIPSSIPSKTHDHDDEKKVKFNLGEHYKGFTFDHKKASESKAKKACNGNEECIGCIDHTISIK